jgi:hypothetical protein
MIRERDRVKIMRRMRMRISIAASPMSSKN